MSQTNRYCPSCGTALQGRFCSGCGAAADGLATRGPGASQRGLIPYLLGGGLVIALLGAIFWNQKGVGDSAGQPLPGNGAAAISAPGTPPDLSAMTPRERFDRLYDRIMRASEAGDTTTVRTFSPMATAAYGMLDQVDTDARFHAGLLQIATGNGAGAAALADTIEAQQPGHLFGIMLRGAVAAQRNDQAALGVARRTFLAAYPTEMAAGRPEYAGHQTLIDRFLKEAKP